MSYTCASCRVQDCIKAPGERNHMPGNCPMREPDTIEEAFCEYTKEENRKFYETAALTGICGKENKLPRVMEMLEFCRRMGYRHIGIACCIGWVREADICARIFRREGFDVDTVMCCAGGINELELGIPVDEKYWDGPNFEVGCNPIGQAKLLQKAGTEFNIVMGLCVGHDSLFFRYSAAPCSVLTVKERCFAHNPVAGLYYAYGCLPPKPETKEEKE